MSSYKLGRIGWQGHRMSKRVFINAIHHHSQLPTVHAAATIHQVKINQLHTSGQLLSDTWSEEEKKEKEEKAQARKDADDEQQIREKILSASLPHVSEHGWTRLALAAGAEDSGYVSVVSGLFPNEGVDLIYHHIQSSNQKLDDWMVAEVNKYKAEEKKLPISKFIKEAVKERLLMNEQFIKNGRWAEALALIANPQHIPTSVGYLQTLCDDIWHRAGDKSADLNWYSKRMLLAGIVSSTEVFMLQDASPEYKETWTFLDRRFEDIAGIPQIGRLPQDLTGILSGLVVTAKNIAGIQK
eukprot:TRINITY_DN37018_c0_g1_i1.p1 TRINITY_DN37018_c0_g1~~TRINITY_DN37018_c0_g1_i1.p1  ORF type:complete len:298 (+),score=51.33 TRINITY_DN37018_c0_g1_i1:32-925(+)